MIEKIKELTREFFRKSGLDGEITVLPKGEDSFQVALKTDEPQMLIGRNGETLAEIQRLLRAVLQHSIGENFYLDLDVNGYKQKKTEYLRQTAKEAADEVFLSQKEKELPPMPSYERRIIHMELSGRSDVKVESMGAEPDRRIVIKPTLT